MHIQALYMTPMIVWISRGNLYLFLPLCTSGCSIVTEHVTERKKKNYLNDIIKKKKLKKYEIFHEKLLDKYRRKYR